MQTCGRWWIAVALMLTLPVAGWAGEVPVAGGQLVTIRLEAPAEDDKRTYLGLVESEAFTPTDIAGRLLVIEIFSMYCPHCQREAPAVNRLHEAIEASEVLRGQVKIIGIGVGNSDFEVNHFRNHYKIAFPLFPDADFLIHQSLGEVRTPFFIITATGAPDKGKIMWTGAGNLEPLETVIGRLNGFLKQQRSR